MNRKCIPFALTLLLWLASFAEASVSEAVKDVSKSFVTISVQNQAGKTLRAGPGLILDSEGILLCGCGLVGKWAENLDYSLTVTFRDGSEMPIANLLSRHCSQGTSYIRVNAQGLRAVSMAGGASRNQKGSYHMYASSSRPADVRLTPSNPSKHDTGRRTSFPEGLHAQLNQKGEVQAIIVADSARGRQQTHTIHADEMSDSLVHLKKTARRLAAVAKLPPPDLAPPPAVSARTAPQEKLARIEELKQKAEKTLDSEIHIALGREYESVNMTTEAIVAFADALKHDPKSVKAHIHLGLAYYRMSRYHEAVKSFSSAVNLDPSLADAHAKLGTVYMIMGDYPRAINSLRQALAGAPDQPSLHFNLGLAYYLKGDKNEALGEYAILKRLNGEWAERLADLMY